MACILEIPFIQYSTWFDYATINAIRIILPIITYSYYTYNINTCCNIGERFNCSFQLYRNFTGIFISMLICIVLGMISMLFFLGPRIFYSSMKAVYMVVTFAPLPAFIASLIALPHKPKHTESAESP